MFTFTNDLCLQRTKKKKRNREKKRRNVRKEGLMSITEKETGNPSKRERDREERKGEDK